MTDNNMEEWIEDGDRFGWEMPCASQWKRLPIIRHIRCMYHAHRVANHEAFWRSIGSIPSGYDNWVLFGIAHGKERNPND